MYLGLMVYTREFMNHEVGPDPSSNYICEIGNLRNKGKLNDIFFWWHQEGNPLVNYLSNILLFVVSKLNSSISSTFVCVELSDKNSLQ